MEFNVISTGIELVGTTVKKMNINNSIVDIEKNCKRSFGFKISEPLFQKIEHDIWSQITIDFELEILQNDEQECRIEFSLEGVFVSVGNIDMELFKSRVMVNGVAALICISRGKIEAITANVFNSGKITIPFVNVLDYYKELE